jgi:hypothetical protein
MDINEVKAWAFDKQLQLEQMQQANQQLNVALTQIAQLVGIPLDGSCGIQAIVDAVGAVVSASKIEKTEG